MMKRGNIEIKKSNIYCLRSELSEQADIISTTRSRPSWGSRAKPKRYPNSSPQPPIQAG
jgi:hypothetical protein